MSSPAARKARTALALTAAAVAAVACDGWVASGRPGPGTAPHPGSPMPGGSNHDAATADASAPSDLDASTADAAVPDASTLLDAGFDAGSGNDGGQRGASTCTDAVPTQPSTGRRLLVTDYGAVPDDASDDIAAIDLAMAAAGPGDAVVLPAGRLRISRSIVMHEAVKLLGAGQGSTFVTHVGTQADWLISINSVNHVEVAGLTLEGDLNPALTAAIGASDGAGHYLHDLTVRNLVSTSAGLGIAFTSQVTDSVICGNTFESMAPASPWGGAIRVSQGSSRNRIQLNHVSSTGRGGIFCDNDSQDVIIQKNVVEGSGVMPGSSGLGVEVWARCHRAVIEDNTLDHYLSVDGSDQVAVRRNTLRDDLRVKALGLELVGAIGTVFTDNRVLSGSQLGISASGPYRKDYAYWGYNTFSHCGTWGAQFQGETEGANFHHFYETEFSDTGRVTYAPLYSGQSHGFRFLGNTNHVTFENVTFRDNVGAAVQGYGEYVSFVDCSLTGNAAAFTDTMGGTDFEMVGTVVTGNGSDAVPATVTPPARPTIAIVGPSTAAVGQPAAYSFTFSSAAGATSTQPLWDFDTGPARVDPAPTVRFPSAGAYRVTLVVWDSNGRSSRVETTVVAN